jgi:hypothetical protein
MPRNGGISFGNQLLLHGASAKPAAAIRRVAALLENKVITILLLLTARRQITMKRSRANTAVDSQQGGRIPWFQVIVNSVIGFGSSRLGFHRLVPILLQKSATMREDCLDLLTRLPTMPLLASGSAPTRDLAPLWLGKACIERWWRSSDQFCEAA